MRSYPIVKRAVAILLLLALSFQFCSRIGVLGYYMLNRQYIASVLCVNKDKPQMHCNGKCYLANKLKHTERLPEAFLLKYRPLEFITQETQHAFTCHTPQAVAVSAHDADHFSVKSVLPVFHPPCA